MFEPADYRWTIFALGLIAAPVAACQSSGPAPPDRAPTEETAPSNGESDESVEAVEQPPSCAPIATDEAIDTTTPEYEAFVLEVKSVGKKVDEEYQRETWQVRALDGASKSQESIAELCSKWVGRPLPQPKSEFGSEGDCTVEFQLGGKVAVISQTLECSSDNCTFDRFVWSANKSNAQEVEHSADFVNVAQGGEFAYYAGQGGGAMDTWVYRERLGSADQCIVTRECFSPRLSPDGESILCRDRGANVNKVAANGGELEVLARASLPAGHSVRLRPQWGEIPQPVEFVDSDNIRYEVTHESDPSATPVTDEHKLKL